MIPLTVSPCPLCNCSLFGVLAVWDGPPEDVAWVVSLTYARYNLASSASKWTLSLQVPLTSLLRVADTCGTKKTTTYIETALSMCTHST